MNTNQNGIFRKKRINYSQVSNIALRDPNLSLKGKGLYSLIQSYITLEDFKLYKTTLKKACKEGEKAFENTWKELKESGYLIQYKMQNSNGTFYYEYELLDEPQNEKNAENSHSNQPPKKEGVDNEPSGQRGGFNNTDSNNTDLNNINKSIYLSNNEKNNDKDRLIDIEKNKKIEIDKMINECANQINEKYLGSFKSYECKKLARISVCDIDLIEYAYDKTVEEVEKGIQLNSLCSYMLKIIENELK